MAIDIQQISANDLATLQGVIYQEMKRRVHKDAYEDEYVFDRMATLEDLANGGITTILEVSEDYTAEAQKSFVRDFFNGDMRAYQEA